MSTPQLDLILTLLGALAVGLAWVILLLLLKIDELNRNIERQKNTPFLCFCKRTFDYAAFGFVFGSIAACSMFFGRKKRKPDSVSTWD